MGKKADRKEARRAAELNREAARRNNRENIIGLVLVALIGLGGTGYVAHEDHADNSRYDCGQEITDYSHIAKLDPKVPLTIPAAIENQCHMQDTIDQLEHDAASK